MTGFPNIIALTKLDKSDNGRFAARSHRFGVVLEHCEAGGCVEPIVHANDRMILLPDAGAELNWTGLDMETLKAVLPGRSVTIVPAGRAELESEGAGRIIQLFGASPENQPDACGALVPDDYSGDQLKPSVGHYTPREPGIKTYPIDDLPNSPGMPRAKLLQSSTLSINWVEYEGPRERSNLSPHHHDDFEQGSLALEGDFVHHFRFPWGKNADEWREDAHLPAGPNSLGIIPPGVIHTTEGLGGTGHLLIDVFSPPRADFRERGLILNAEDYSMLSTEGRS